MSDTIFFSLKMQLLEPEPVCSDPNTQNDIVLIQICF